MSEPREVDFPDQIRQALSKQLNAELASSYLYFRYGAICSLMSLKGWANWFFKHANEESGHARKITEYIIDRGSMPVFSRIEATRLALKTIRSPEDTLNQLITIFRDVVQREKDTSNAIIQIRRMAIALEDETTAEFLSWFIKEQIEEVATPKEYLDKLQMSPPVVNANFLTQLDKEFNEAQ